MSYTNNYQWSFKQCQIPEITYSVLSNNFLTPSEKLWLIFFLAQINRIRLSIEDSDGWSWCSKKCIRQGTSISQRTQIDIEKHLQKLGILETHRKERKNYFRINVVGIQNFLLSK